MNDMRDATTGADNQGTTLPAEDSQAGSTAGASDATTPPTGNDETFGWTTPDEEPSSGGAEPRAAAERMIGQLQSMIDGLATQAAPVARQIGAKAAELAAVAAERAGPLAHKAADATADASVRLAERSRTWAADLRNKAEDALGDDAERDSRSSASVEGADDAVEHAAQDDPAEGSRR